MFVVLDCGEDKPDDFPVYAGLNDFDSYRSEQARWFAELIRSKEYRTARWHVVMNHFPPVSRMDPIIPSDTACSRSPTSSCRFSTAPRSI